MKRKFFLALTVVATVTLSSCNEDIDGIYSSEESRKDGKIENVTLKEKVVVQRFFDGYIIYHDKSEHRAVGIFEATFEDGKLVDLKFYGMIDGVDGTFGFMIQGKSNEDVELFIIQNDKEYQVLKDEILDLFKDEIKK